MYLQNGVNERFTFGIKKNDKIATQFKPNLKVNNEVVNGWETWALNFET